MDDVVTKLQVQVLPARLIAQISDKILEAQPSAFASVAVTFAVLANNGRCYVVLVPWLEAWVLHKLVLEGRYETFKGVSDDEELKVCVQSETSLK